MSTHQPECPVGLPKYADKDYLCICLAITSAYRRGYNDHATSNIIGAELYGVPLSTPVDAVGETA